jgi:hypothetical protein
MLASLREVIPPSDLAAVHSSDHLISFAAHVQQILARPVEVKEVEGHRLVHILGQAVLARTPAGTLDLYVWWRPSAQKSWALYPLDPDYTPFLDFPRTTLWADNLREALQREATRRVGDETQGARWAKWVWSWIDFKVVSRVDLRRVHAQIRGALDLDRVVLSLLRHRRQFVLGATYHVDDYNEERRDRDKTLLLKHEGPALLPLYWALRNHPDFDRTLEPKKALRRFARAQGVMPQQWKLIAEAGKRGQRLYRALCREFFVGDERHNALSYLALIRLLRPKHLPSLEFWRQILSLCGTRMNPSAVGYADYLARCQDTLRHLVRLADTRVESGETRFAAEELHAVLAWIADCGINHLTPSQRRGGWSYLVRCAAEHRIALRAAGEEPRVWGPILSSFEIGQFRVVPLASSEALWEEALTMRHCADRFIERCARQDAALFSLQRHTGKRVATLAFVNNGHEWAPLELAGKANSEPSIEVRKAAVEVCERMQSIPVPRTHDNGDPPFDRATSLADAVSFYEALDREEELRRLLPRRDASSP